MVMRKGCSLLHVDCSLFDVDLDIGLLVEPIIMRLPFLLRGRKADTKESDKLGDKLIYLTQ